MSFHDLALGFTVGFVVALFTYIMIGDEAKISADNNTNDNSIANNSLEDLTREELEYIQVFRARRRDLAREMLQRQERDHDRMLTDLNSDDRNNRNHRNNIYNGGFSFGSTN